MSASTIEAPVAAPRVGLRFVVEGPPVGALWRRALLRAMLVPLPVLAPLIALAPTRDHRFNLYWHGGLFRDDPLRIGSHTVDSLPGYLRLGNFRLLGRMVEKALDTLAYALSEVLGLPVNVGFRLISFLAAMLLCVTAVLAAESIVARGRLFRQAPSTMAAVVPFAVAAGFVAAGGSSPVVLFGGLYLTSAAVVLGVPAGMCLIDFDRRFRLWWVPLLLLGGAALAAFNEIAYLALPLATVAVLARGWLVRSLRLPGLLIAAPTRALGLLWLGFLPVFLAVRVVIQRYCAAGSCYRGSDVQFGPSSLEAFPVRAIAWLPPLMWRAAVTGGSSRPWLGGLTLIGALIVLGVLACLAIRDLPRLSQVSRRGALAVVLTAATLILLGAAMSALNADVQKLVATGRWGYGWRDSAVTTTAGALLVVAAVHFIRRRHPNTVGPHALGPHVAGSHVAGSLAVGPHAAGPHVADSRATGHPHVPGQSHGPSAPQLSESSAPHVSQPAHPPGVVGRAYPPRGRRFELSTGAVAVAVVLLAGTAAVSAAANKRLRDTTMATPAARLADRVAVEMADFDPGPAGAARRCALRAEFLALHGDSPFSVRRFDESLEAASRQRAGVAFCPDRPSGGTGPSGGGAVRGGGN